MLPCVESVVQRLNFILFIYFLNSSNQRRIFIFGALGYFKLGVERYWKVYVMQISTTRARFIF